MSVDLFYVLECEADGCLVEFFLNDLPVCRRGDAETGVFYAVPNNELLQPGANDITLVVRPGPCPSQALTGPGGVRERTVVPPGARAQAVLKLYPRGAIIGGPDGFERGRVAWVAPDGPAFFPQVASTTVEFEPPFGPWAWLDLPRLTLDDATRASATAFLTDLREALAATYVERYVDVCRQHRFPDLEAAHYLPEGDRAAEAEKLLPDFIDEEFVFEPIESQELDFRVVGKGRLLQLVDARWQPALRQVPDDKGQGASFPLIVGKSGDEWEVVR